MRQGRKTSINTFHNDTYHRDVGTLGSLLAAQIDFQAAIARRAT
jgi:hypothetical protein